jgi:hypothetical protein
MLSHGNSPSVDANGTYVFPIPTGTGHSQFTEVEQYGVYARWIFDHPDRSIGKEISLGIFSATAQEIAQSFTEVTGHPATVNGSVDQWFTDYAAFSDPDAKMPTEIPGGENDDSRYTFRQSFSSFWHLWSMLLPHPQPSITHNLM